jgi:hypothetical protein
MNDPKAPMSKVALQNTLDQMVAFAEMTANKLKTTEKPLKRA